MMFSHAYKLHSHLARESKKCNKPKWNLGMENEKARLSQTAPLSSQSSVMCTVTMCGVGVTHARARAHTHTYIYTVLHHRSISRPIKP